MVVFNIKTSDSESFLYETTSENNGDKVIREIVEIWNLRLQLQQLCGKSYTSL